MSEPNCICEDVKQSKINPACYWHGEKSGYQNAEYELASIDAVLARRPALYGRQSRAEKVELACNTAAKQDAQICQLKQLARVYLQAESAYHQAQLKGDAGIGLCVKAEEAAGKLREAIG